MRVIGDAPVFGDPIDVEALAQSQRCRSTADAAALMADDHIGSAVHEPPLVIARAHALSDDHVASMRLAGAFAHADRDRVFAEVVQVLGARVEDEAHDPHDVAWLEEFQGEGWVVVRRSLPAGRWAGSWPHGLPGRHGLLGPIGPAAILEPQSKCL